MLIKIVVSEFVILPISVSIYIKIDDFWNEGAFGLNKTLFFSGNLSEIDH